MKKEKNKGNSAQEKEEENDLFLGDYFLKSFINSIDISDKRKSFLTAKLPEFGKEERKSLLIFLKDIYISDPEQKKMIDKVTEKWKEA